jgi:hypothetical protein
MSETKTARANFTTRKAIIAELVNARMSLAEGSRASVSTSLDTIERLTRSLMYKDYNPEDMK